MNFKEKYEQALQRAKSLYGNCPTDGDKSKTITTIFPELAESEDERIREWLIEECQKVIDIANPAYDTSKAKKAIAWLEKQKDSIPYEKYVYDIAAINAEAKTKYHEGWNDGYEAKWKEQKPEYASASTIMIPSCWEEKQKEQSAKIERIQQKWYMEGYRDGAYKFEPKWIYVKVDGKEECKLNARYGKRLHEQNPIPLMNGDADLYFDEWNQRQQNPTKRQCFEEGLRYSDMVHLELKQKEQKAKSDTIDCAVFSDGSTMPIKDRTKEQKPVDEKIVDEVGKSVRKKWALDFINYLDANRFEGKMNVSNAECKDIEEAFFSADWEKIYKYCNKYLQKPAEPSDTENSDFKVRLADYMQKASQKDGRYVLSSESILKMAEEELIKRGVVQQPAEWSEEDEKCLQEMIRHIEHCVKVYGAEQPEWQRWLNLLNSLRHQPKQEWKPSEEQMNSLDYGIYVLEEEGYDASASEIKELYEQLKKLM